MFLQYFYNFVLMALPVFHLEFYFASPTPPTTPIGIHLLFLCARSLVISTLLNQKASSVALFYFTSEQH